jgi:hypothetical protein
MVSAGCALPRADIKEETVPITRYALQIACLAAFLGAGALTAPARAEAAAEKPAMTAEQKKARSKECSAEANKRGLHGRERQKFRNKCKREGPGT